MEAPLLDLLTTQVTIQRPVDSGEDEHGNPDSTWTAIATVPASVQYFVGSEDRTDRDLGQRRWNVYVDGGTDVRNQDRVVHGTVTMEVIDVKIAWSPLTNEENHRKAICLEIDSSGQHPS